MTPTDIDPSSLLNYHEKYREIHLYIGSVICVFSITSSVLSIVVLSRRYMMSPTNCILTVLAVAEFLLMASFLVYVIYTSVVIGSHTFEGMYPIAYSAIFSVASHNLMLWLTLSLAAFQYISVRFPLAANTYCSMKRAKITIVTAVIASVSLSLPSFLLYQFAPINSYNTTRNRTGYWAIDSNFALTDVQYKDAMFWFYGVFMKVIPSVLVAVLSSAIVHAVKKADQRRQDFLGTQVSRQRDCHRTNQMTYMLVAIMVLFVITEFPHGLLIMISRLDEHFFFYVFSYIGDILDLLLLIKCATTFVIYCTMSKNFRTTFCKLIKRSVQ